MLLSSQVSSLALQLCFATLAKSCLPFIGHVSGNIMSTTYAVAEKGSDILKGDDGRYGLQRVDSGNA